MKSEAAHRVRRLMQALSGAREGSLACLLALRQNELLHVSNCRSLCSASSVGYRRRRVIEKYSFMWLPIPVGHDIERQRDVRIPPVPEPVAS